MTDEESSILEFLRSSPDSYFTRREIARKAVPRHVFEEDNHWVNVPLASLVARKEVEQDESGLYRFRPRRY